ncbi:MAG TPA: carboxypeptidase regulatory-like domain-containing protein [Gemmatimonadaceae bacterium]|jgi:hypothetical protein
MTIAACAIAVRGASAQTIRGVVVDAADRPVQGVVIFLLDSTSNVVARTLSTETGDFRVVGPRAGTYRLRTMRIGYRPTVTDGMVALLGGEVNKRVTLSGAAIALDTMRVVERNSCRVMSDETAALTYSVLEQARTALSAAQLTMSGRTISATTTAYERVLEPDGRRVTNQSSRTATAYVTQPWRAISPDSAHRAGFVLVANDNSITYFAPSIDVLLSSVFVEDHCFRLITDKKEPNAVGVAFEPSSDRKSVSEIKGTLWVDRKSAELQRLDYRYVNIAHEQQDAGAGGDVSFAKLSNGGWMISRWNIRMPVLELMVRSQAFGGTKASLAAIQVSGGEVRLATRTRQGTVDTLWTRPGLILNGSVVDSARGGSIATARVDLIGANLFATTDARGHFAIANVLPGTYSVETVTPELAAIGAANQSTIVFEDSTASYQIKVPTPLQLVESICAGRTLGGSEAAIVGRVHLGGDTLPAVGATVVAEWTSIALRDEHGVTAERTGRRLEGKTNANGMYRLCGVPMSTNITVTASTTSTTSGARPVFSGSRIVREELSVDQELATTATFAGRVLVDSTTTPIEGAEIFFPELSKVGRSVANGEFRVADIPAGEQHLLVRRVGYGVLDTKISFAAHATADRNVYLSRVATIDSVVVTDHITDRRLRDFEDNRRTGLGHFADRAELAKLPATAKVDQVVGQWLGVGLVGGNHKWILGARKAPAPCMLHKPITRECALSQGMYFPDASDSSMGVVPACYAKVYVDETLMNGGYPTRPFEVSSVFADQVEAIEWYAGASQTPAKYADLNSGCGVLVIHTRRIP